MNHTQKNLMKLNLKKCLTKGVIHMKVIEVAHPIQDNQYITEAVAMAFGFFDGMHKGHAKVFETLDAKAIFHLSLLKLRLKNLFRIILSKIM